MLDLVFIFMVDPQIEVIVPFSLFTFNFPLLSFYNGLQSRKA